TTSPALSPNARSRNHDVVALCAYFDTKDFVHHAGEGFDIVGAEGAADDEGGGFLVRDDEFSCVVAVEFGGSQFEGSLIEDEKTAAPGHFFGARTRGFAGDDHGGLGSHRIVAQGEKG